MVDCRIPKYLVYCELNTGTPASATKRDVETAGISMLAWRQLPLIEPIDDWKSLQKGTRREEKLIA